jgi:dipeptide/tripeptide permease
VANTIELFERWAWYGFFMLFANYLTGSSDLGGLEFTQSQKGLIMGVGTGILYFLPVLTGAIADRYGYKRVLIVAFIIYASAFALFPLFSSFAAVFAMYIYLAIGAALFKPVISATVAKTTTKETSSIGFGIFYMMVNLGAFFGPLVTLLFRGRTEMVFYVSAGIILLNFLLLPFYKEPGREAKSADAPKESLGATIGGIFRNMASTVRDGKFLVFLLIVAGFWAMYNQLFFTLPVFITQWVDTSSMYNFFSEYLPFFSNNYSPAPGVMDAEFITNFDALFIIIFQIGVSTLIMKWRPLTSMVTGFLVCAVGMALTLFSQNVMFTMAAILIFALGEMAGSPKITEYIGMIAPKDKKALYMGYSFIPVFIGNILAGIISGNLYQATSDKVSMTARYAAEHGYTLNASMSTNDAFASVASQAGLTPTELTSTLWQTYNPSKLWLIILAIGIVAAGALYIYDRATRKKAEL